MQYINKRRIIFFTLFILVVFGISFAAYWNINTRTLTVKYKNSKDLLIYRYTDLRDNVPNKKPVAKITHSGQKFNIWKDDYAIQYSGAKTFISTYTKSIHLNKDREISIDPYFSSSHLSYLLKEQRSYIDTIIKTYNNISQYEIQDGKLYHWGEWYATTLVYIGSNQNNSDTLRVVLYKNSQGWQKIMATPNIIVSHYKYPQIPEDVLYDINNNQLPKMKDVFNSPYSSSGLPAW